MLRRHRSGRKLTDQRAHITHLVQQVTMSARVGAIHPAGEHRDRVPTGRQRRALHGSFDAIGATGHQHAFTVREVGSQFARDMLPIRRGRPRPRDRHQIVQRSRQERRRPAHEQIIQSAIAEIVQRLRPVRITRNQRGDPALFNHAKSLVEPFQPARWGEAVMPHLTINPS